MLSITTGPNIDLTCNILMNVSLSAESVVKLNWEQSESSGRVVEVVLMEAAGPTGCMEK